MVLYSTRESIRDEKVSILAVVESVSLSAISFWLFWSHGYAEHIAAASIIAPFLLTRTPMSTALTIIWCARLGTIAGAPIRVLVAQRPNNTLLLMLAVYSAGPLILLFMVVFAFLCLIVKVAVGIWMLIRHPILSVSAIPNNWRRLVLCTDSVAPPEFLPGSREILDKFYEVTRRDEVSGTDQEHFGILDIDRHWERYRSKTNKSFIDYFGYLPPLIMFSVPAVAYRFSLKSTAIVWSPLLWELSPNLGDERGQAAAA